MSISTVNMFYQGTSANQGGGNSSYPTVSGEVVAASAMSGAQAQDLAGFALPVLDGSATTFTVNWIDGTATLLYPPSAVFAYHSSPPAWTALTTYPVGAIVLGSAHVQQVTVAGKTAVSAPSWHTDGTTVTDGTVTWKDLGAEGLSTINVPSVTAITNLGALVTLSAAGTSTQVIVIALRLMH